MAKTKGRNERAQGLFMFGRNISMTLEAGIIGFLPLILFILEVISAIAEASLVEQVMPYFEGTFTKAIIYTGVGMGAGIYFAPNFSWMRQCKHAIEEMKKNSFVAKEFKDATIKNLQAAHRRFAWTGFFCLAVALISHGITLYFMEVAFWNKKTLELLEIANMGEVPYTLAASVSIMGFTLDILLGLTTSTRIDKKDYYPANEENEALLEWANEYEELLQKESEQYEKIVGTREKVIANREKYYRKMRDLDIKQDKLDKGQIADKKKEDSNDKDKKKEKKK